MANLIFPQSPFLDPTGRPAREWVQWLQNPDVQTITAVTFTVDNIILNLPLEVIYGGTGLTAIPTNGQLLIGDGTGYTLNTLTAGTGLAITNGAGSITPRIANTTVSAGNYGSASSVSSFTVNAQGQLTAAGNTPISISYTQVTGLGTMATQNANSVAITGGTILGTDLNTQANTNSVLAWIGTTSQPTVNVYPIMTTLAILDGYYFNDLENATPLYQGKSDINANWLVIEYDQTAGTINYANVGNNPTYTDYNSAWAARATLVYDEFQDMVFP
jgi:hypothetical protein